MISKNVIELKPLERFLYWMKERHAVYLRRQRGEAKPWTNDEVLRTVFFTNPYREHDKTTAWFRGRVRWPHRDDPRVLMATVIFRWFNRIETGELLMNHGLLLRWNADRAQRLLEEAWGLGQRVFTGAYMIKAGDGPRGCKIGHVCQAIDAVWRDARRLEDVCLADCRLEALWKELCGFKFLGGFMAYEIVCDLRYTYLLEHASDVDTWANPGPGALRGLLRLEGGVPGKGREDACYRVKEPLEKMRALLKVARRRLRSMPRMELREIEHSLCEYDKYERALFGQGHLKRRYDGV